jgi:putative transposase
MNKTVFLGYKYRLYPTEEQKKVLDHQMFVYNQSYNICLNLWQKEQERNKKLDKDQRKYRKDSSYDRVIKRALKLRKIPFSSVVIQQARINFLKAVKRAFSKYVVDERNKALSKAITPKEKAKALSIGFPKFKSSKDVRQSSVWSNQNVSIKETDKRNAILKLMKQNIKLRYHRELPKEYKLTSVVISRDATGYYASVGISFEKEMEQISINSLKEDNCIGIDMNVYNFAVSSEIDFLFEPISNLVSVESGNFINNGSSNRKILTEKDIIRRLKRKQSRRILKSKKTKSKLGRNYNKTQQQLNKLHKKITNKKMDLYHQISSRLTNKFDLIVVEDLKLKNMTKSAKGNEVKHGKNVRQKAGLNKAILGASFYQFTSMLEYKQSLNGKLFVKVDPAYTSMTCLNCGNIDKNNRPKQDKFKCTACGHETNPDHQASVHILYRGMKSFGLGTNLVDLYKHKAFRVSASLEAAS